MLAALPLSNPETFIRDGNQTSTFSYICANVPNRPVGWTGPLSDGYFELQVRVQATDSVGHAFVAITSPEIMHPLSQQYA